MKEFISENYEELDVILETSGELENLKYSVRKNSLNNSIETQKKKKLQVEISKNKQVAKITNPLDPTKFVKI